MDEKKTVRTSLVSTDMDANGNVTIWDRGPQPLPEGARYTDDQRKAYAAEREDWTKRYGTVPVPVVMASTDATHTLSVDPVRYSIEPDVDDGAVNAKVKEIQDARVKSLKAAADQATALQLAADRKTAIGVVMAERKAKYEAEKLAPRPAGAPSSDAAKRLRDARANEDTTLRNQRADQDRVTPPAPDVIEARRIADAEIAARRAEEDKRKVAV